MTRLASSLSNLSCGERNIPDTGTPGTMNLAAGDNQTDNNWVTQTTGTHRLGEFFGGSVIEMKPKFRTIARGNVADDRVLGVYYWRHHRRCSLEPMAAHDVAL